MCYYCENECLNACPNYSFDKWTEQMKLKYKNWIPITLEKKMKLIENNIYMDYLDKLKENKRCVPKIVWLTIRPKKCTEKLFQEFIEKILNWKCVENYYCAYEWKHDTNGSGLHAHIILEGENKRILENIRKKSKATTLRKIGKCMFFSKLIKRDLLQDKIDYCNGKTWEVEKDEQKKSNIYYRKLYNMPNKSTYPIELKFD